MCYGTNMLNEVLVISFLAICPLLISAYEAPEDKQDIFASKACPAFLVFENFALLVDMTIELPCHCKPEEVHSVVWYYQKQIGSMNTKILTDFEGTKVLESSKVGRGSDLHRRFSIRLFSLLIFRVQRTDSGHYICGTASGEFFYGHNVDVQQVHQVLFPWNLNQNTQAAEPSTIKTELFQVFTSYRAWSNCDRCDIQGEQTRVGLCYVKSIYLHVRYHHESDTVAPCGSSAVPQSFGLSSRSFGAKLEVRNCHTSCPPKPKVTPEKQALLKFLEYDNRDSAEVSIHFHNHPVDSDLVLTCPGAKPQYAVAWDKGSVPLYLSQYMEGLNKTSRVFIDTGHHLHFRPVWLEDKGSYFCWLQGKLAAEIRLGVYLRLGRLRQIYDPESAYALQAILVCYICISVLFLLTVLARFVWQFINEEKTADMNRT
ncbi:Ig-like V-type domain-containing protein FAM187A [Xyrauchen texanus]|uniref:Ig-like V-type domain-containing protein FAM187A n=1 Tax=Xyrauchen texanus TaxID=154827 RepID=UPI002242A3D0|nr:Ig-like V-type domain-containing protein FAM187A [Xyrauchen texanus]